MLNWLKKINRKYSIYYLRRKPLLWFYSAYITIRYVDDYNVFPAITFIRYQKVLITKGKGAKFTIKKSLIFDPWLKGSGVISIILANKATLSVERDFILGNNIKISVSENGRLTLQGKENESGSGITANSVILVNKNLEIGKDCIIAWDTFLTDCDWHKIDGKSSVMDTIIGNHVWIGVGAKILKGVHIGDNSIVTSNSVVLKGTYEERSLISGNPATVIRSNISDWHRDLT